MSKRLSVSLFKCGGCGCESEVEEAFRKLKLSLFAQPLFLCPECWSKRYIAKSKISFCIIGFAFLVGLIIHYYDPSIILGFFLMNIVLLYFFMQLMAIPHELGHAIVGKLLHYEIFLVIIGYGKTLFTRSVLGCEWEFRPFPIGGVTLIATRFSRFYRLRRFVMLLAGPLVHVIFIVILFWILPDGSLGSYSFIGMEPDIDFLLANTLLLVLNLWPYKITTAAGVIESDGLALITTPFSKQNKIEEHLATYYLLAAHKLSRLKQFVQAVSACEEGMRFNPDAVPLRVQLGVIFLSLNEFEKARSSFTELLACKDIHLGQKMIILNNIAYTNLLSGRSDLIEESNRYSEEAYKNIPWVPAIKGTRGAILVETGCVDEGLALLREAFDATSEPEGKARNAAYIALGEKLLGNMEESARNITVARTLDPQCKLLNRVNEASPGGVNL